MWSADVAALSVDGWQPNEDAVVMRSQRLVTSVQYKYNTNKNLYSAKFVDKTRQRRYRQILWSSAVLASAHHHTQFVLDALCGQRPCLLGDMMIMLTVQLKQHFTWKHGSKVSKKSEFTPPSEQPHSLTQWQVNDEINKSPACRPLVNGFCRWNLNFKLPTKLLLLRRLTRRMNGR